MQSDRLAPPAAPENNYGRPASGSIRSADDTGNRDGNYDRRPSIRIRRSFIGDQNANNSNNGDSTSRRGSAVLDGRRLSVFGSGRGRDRSNSAPQRPILDTAAGIGGTEVRGQPLVSSNSYMPEVREECVSPTSGRLTVDHPVAPDGGSNENIDGVSSSDAYQLNPAPISSWRPLRRARTNIADEKAEEESNDNYESELVDVLDLVDPEVATLSTLTNVQNSLFVPDLGRYLNRRPTYTLTRRPTDIDDIASSSDDGDESKKLETRGTVQRTYSGGTLTTITSRVNESHYAVLPHGVRLPGWSEEEKSELDDHVRHMLHSKRSKFRMSLKGFGQYVRKPLGLFVTVYATLITLFGLAWVLFLIGWVNVGGRQLYIINVIDNVLVALFALIGDGLAPFRTVDTYHMCFIAHYHHLTWRLRREQSLPKLQNKNDLPGIQGSQIDDNVLPPPATSEEPVEFSVLTPAQQKRLAHHQKKFAKSHSFYKPHATETHHAFPLNLLVAIVVLLDCHSLLQIALGTCTWSIYYKNRPFALTTVILCCSITCNITAGVLITIGDHKTRKKDVVEKMKRQELTRAAMKKVERKKKSRDAAAAAAAAAHGDVGTDIDGERDILEQTYDREYGREETKNGIEPFPTIPEVPPPTASIHDRI